MKEVLMHLINIFLIAHFTHLPILILFSTEQNDDNTSKNLMFSFFECLVVTPTKDCFSLTISIFREWKLIGDRHQFLPQGFFQLNQ